ncbi:MAG: tRNA pseudouridine(55) synthase TruB [Actinobacteria bacterium QS_8_72_14]|nr:MAG: tRNA pseudouridine(55) synthase TruB [Actinobacteria bacterium QS_8_72_14]
MMGMDGVLCIDKPAGVTSHDVVARVRRALGGPRRGKNRRKVGHAGTLDPGATGLLVVAVGRATRLVPWLQTSTKTYEAELRLGVATTTLDASGEVWAQRDASHITEDALCEVLREFTGDITQLPPMVSAVRQDGERLHVKARRGEDVERAERDVTIHDLVLEDFELGAQGRATFLVTCSPGTYVRTLAADVGERLGVGAHLSALRRLGSGRFSVQDAVTVETVEELAQQGRLAETLLPMAQAVGDLTSLVADEHQAAALAHGRAVASTGQPGAVAAVDADGGLLAILEDDGSRAQPKAVFAQQARSGSDGPPGGPGAGGSGGPGGGATGSRQEVGP